MDIYLYDRNLNSRSAMRLLLQENYPLAEVRDVLKPEEVETSCDSAEPCLLLLSWDSLSKEADKRAWIAPFKERASNFRIIALSGRPEISAQSYRAGVDGFVCKCDPPERLLSVIEQVMATFPGTG